MTADLLERRLREAVAAAPADDAARLVYADHMLQRGDARGDFVIAQFAVATAARTTQAYRRSRTLEHVLLTRDRWRWMKRAGIPVGRWRSHVEVTFRRGFIAEATMKMGEVRERCARLALLPLEHLRIVPGVPAWRRPLSLGDMRWLAAQPFAARLQRLTIRIERWDITLDAQAAFALCRARQKADHGSVWSDRFSDGFLHPTVTELSLDLGWYDRHRVFVEGFALPPRVRRLDLVSDRLTPWPEGFFERLVVDPHARQVEAVSIPRTHVRDVQVLCERWPFPHARRLHIGVWDGEGQAAVAASGALAGLEAFSTNMPLDRALMEALARAPLEELAALNGIASDAAPLLDAPALHTLDVRGGIAPPLLEMLERPRRLSSLRLHDIALEDDEAMRLAEMDSLAGLFELHVDGSALSEHGARALLQSTTLADVPWLDLGHTRSLSKEILRERIARSSPWSSALRAELARTP